MTTTLNLNLTALASCSSLIEVVPPHLLTSQMIEDAIKKENGNKFDLRRLPVHLLTSKMVVDAINKMKITRFAEIPEAFQTDNVVMNAFFNKNRVLQEDIPGLTAEFITTYKLWYGDISLLKTKTPEIILALISVRKDDMFGLKQLFQAIPDDYWTEAFTDEFIKVAHPVLFTCVYREPKFYEEYMLSRPLHIRQYNCWIKEFGIKYTVNPTEEQVILALTTGGPATLDLINESLWTPAVLQASVTSRPLGTMQTKGFAEHQTPELVQLAVFRSPWVIRFVRKDLRTPELLDVAFELVAAGYDPDSYTEQPSNPLQFAEETGNRVLAEKLAKLLSNHSNPCCAE